MLFPGGWRQRWGWQHQRILDAYHLLFCCALTWGRKDPRALWAPWYRSLFLLISALPPWSINFPKYPLLCTIKLEVRVVTWKPGWHKYTTNHTPLYLSTERLWNSWTFFRSWFSVLRQCTFQTLETWCYTCLVESFSTFTASKEKMDSFSSWRHRHLRLKFVCLEEGTLQCSVSCASQSDTVCSVYTSKSYAYAIKLPRMQVPETYPASVYGKYFEKAFFVSGMCQMGVLCIQTFKILEKRKVGYSLTLTISNKTGKFLRQSWNTNSWNLKRAANIWLIRYWVMSWRCFSRSHSKGPPLLQGLAATHSSVTSFSCHLHKAFLLCRERDGILLWVPKPSCVHYT